MEISTPCRVRANPQEQMSSSSRSPRIQFSWGKDLTSARPSVEDGVHSNDQLLSNSFAVFFSCSIDGRLPSRGSKSLVFRSCIKSSGSENQS